MYCSVKACKMGCSDANYNSFDIMVHCHGVLDCWLVNILKVMFMGPGGPQKDVQSPWCFVSLKKY